MQSLTVGTQHKRDHIKEKINFSKTLNSTSGDKVFCQACARFVSFSIKDTAYAQLFESYLIKNKNKVYFVKVWCILRTIIAYQYCCCNWRFDYMEEARRWMSVPTSLNSKYTYIN
jgi:hypothetical protein